MSEFDELEAGFAPHLVAQLGDAAAVTAYDPSGEQQPLELDAIVGRLRTVEIDDVGQGILRREQQEEVRLELSGPGAERVRIRWKLIVKKYTVGDASSWPGQRFVIESVDGRTDGLVAVTARRKLLAAVKRAGNERGTR